MASTTVRKTYLLFDEEQQVWFNTYEAPGIEGRPIIAEVPREVSAPRTVSAHLLSKGAEHEAVEDAEALAAAIAADAPVVRRAAQTGWRTNNQAFVSHRFVSPEALETAILSPSCPLIGAAGQLRVCGTLEGWKNLVAVAQHSTAMTVALCATFAAPLLTLLHRPSFALVQFGRSKVGKSFAQLVAASAMGFGYEKELPTLNATPAGLLAAALAFNDHMLPINEVGTAQGKKRDIYEVLRETTYALLSGQDKVRHPSWPATNGLANTFGVIVLFSSEISPDAWAARNGEARDDGEMARLIGVPVLAPGCETIFDQPPSKLVGDALATWERAQFAHLHRELPNQRGIAFRDYVDDLLGDVEGCTAQAAELVEFFEAKLANENASQVARDIIAKFGLLYAGGILAVDAGVLPLDRNAILPALRRACRDALGELPDPQGELRADLASLRDRLASGAVVNLNTCSEKEARLIRNADGFRKRRENGKGEDSTIRAQAFVGWFPNEARARRVLDWLDDEGFLNHSRDRADTRSIEWAQRQATWPDGTRVRSFTIYVPNGLADLDLDG